MNHLGKLADFGLVGLSTLLGIMGMGLLYRGLTSGLAILLAWGALFTLFGLYWSGRALGRGMSAVRASRQTEKP